MNVLRKGGEIISSVLYRCTYTNIISLLMSVCMKSVAKQPHCVHTSFPQGGAYFPAEHLQSLIDKCHL